jgi:CBS domain containing-hemolysin-like protein
MDSLIPALIIMLLIVVNGVFVAAEFAIIGAPLASLERRAKQGHGVARRVVAILRNPRQQDQYIATAQLGITFASLGLGMYGEHVLAEWLLGAFAAFGGWEWLPRHTAATVVSIASLTYLHIVLGEMVPKALALQQAERTTLWTARPVLAVKMALYPLVFSLNSLGNWVLRWFGVNRQFAQSLGHTPAELEYLIEESQQGGALRKESGTLLQDLLRFTSLTAGEVLVPRVKVAGIPLGEPASELARLLRNSHYTRFPVYRNGLDDIAGCVHVKDLLDKLLNDQPVSQDDLRPVAFVPHTAGVDAVMTAMQSAKAELAVVLDEYGGTAGIVTVKDLMDEVLGEIHEDSERLEIQMLSPARLEVAGTVRLAEIGERLDVDLEHEEVETAGGLVMAQLERPPQVGDTVEYKGVQFEVTGLAGKGVKTCRVTRLGQQA